MHPSIAFLYLLSEWAVRFIMLVYVPQRRSPAAARTWLLLIFLLPWPGFLLYAIIGRIKFPAWRVARQRTVSGMILEWQGRHPLPAPTSVHGGRVPELVLALGDFRPLEGNTIELLPDYDASILRLVEAIDGARQSVHLLYYIFADDDRGGRVVEALLRARARGVECRVLVDAVGSRKFALVELLKKLLDAGIPAHEALPAGIFRRNAARFDLRNHRKVAVIDKDRKSVV